MARRATPLEVAAHRVASAASPRSFAMASLEEIYSSESLNESSRYSAKTLQSATLMNDGTGVFEFQSLPRLAQAAPGFGVVVTEVDGDGYPDIYMVQNFFSPQAETGRMDGGLSLPHGCKKDA